MESMPSPDRSEDAGLLENRWDDAAATKLNPPELLRYRSNLLGSDRRITNFRGQVGTCRNCLAIQI